MRPSAGVPLSTCADPQACDQNINRANLCENELVRKILLVSVKFVSAILGPEMGAPILWTPGKCVLSAGKTMSVNSPFLGGVLGGGGSADFIFMGARIFLNWFKHIAP